MALSYVHFIRTKNIFLIKYFARLSWSQAVNEWKRSTFPYGGIKLNVLPRKCVY